VSPITVRRATLSDLDALSGLFDRYRQFYRCASDAAAARAFLQERLQGGESVIFLAHEGKAAAGFTQLYPSFSSTSLGRTFILNDLFVEQRCRRRGAGAQLMRAATDFARSAGAIGLTLATARTNATAQALYESMGWRRDEEFCVYELDLLHDAG
jgi:ribosomal protein S18 acetylase RimI-like enzyme